MKLPEFIKKPKSEPAEESFRYIKTGSPNYLNVPLVAMPATIYQTECIDSDGRALNEQWYEDRWKEIKFANCTVADFLDDAILGAGAVQAGKLRNLLEGEHGHIVTIATAEAAEEPYFDEIVARVTAQIEKFDNACRLCEQINKVGL